MDVLKAYTKRLDTKIKNLYKIWCFDLLILFNRILNLCSRFVRSYFDISVTSMVEVLGLSNKLRQPLLNHRHMEEKEVPPRLSQVVKW